MQVTVAVATIPPRATKLAEALVSVTQQTRQPDAIVVEYDHERTGAAATKNRALARVATGWVAWLDDDDLLRPEHLATLTAAAESSGADVVYSWPEVIGWHDALADRFGEPFDPEELRRGNYIHTTALFRADMARSVGGFKCPPGTDHDDWGLYLGLLNAGAMFHHVPARTWCWRLEGGNTGGRPDRW